MAGRGLRVPPRPPAWDTIHRAIRACKGRSASGGDGRSVSTPASCGVRRSRGFTYAGSVFSPNGARFFSPGQGRQAAALGTVPPSALIPERAAYVTRPVHAHPVCRPYRAASHLPFPNPGRRSAVPWARGWPRLRRSRTSEISSHPAAIAERCGSGPAKPCPALGGSMLLRFPPANSSDCVWRGRQRERRCVPRPPRRTPRKETGV